CCHTVLIRYSSNLIGRLFYLWYTQFHGFYPRLSKPQWYEGKKMHVMGCRYLKKDGTCRQYRLRPLVCRQWPMIEYFGYPQILKGCGYRSNPPYPQETPDDAFEEKSDPRLKVIQ
ncbi:MAG: YkgJ family cysteine cluster protein, partial [Chlamydiia bacterium]|nr:YkgJ family cysteine cluster protein [Chlamydiia bacterium]